MRRIIVTPIILLFLTLQGCSLNKQFVQAIDQYATTCIPEYKEYVMGDSTLSDDSKRIRLQSADKFLETVSRALDEIGSN